MSITSSLVISPAASAATRSLKGPLSGFSRRCWSASRKNCSPGMTTAVAMRPRPPLELPDDAGLPAGIGSPSISEMIVSGRGRASSVTISMVPRASASVSSSSTTSCMRGRHLSTDENVKWLLTGLRRRACSGGSAVTIIVGRSRRRWGIRFVAVKRGSFSTATTSE